MKRAFNISDDEQFPDTRRRSVRYLISAAVRFRWRAKDGSWHEASGCTRNISRSGTFIESDELPPVGSAVKIVATLPTEWRTDGTLHLRGAGDVRHVLQHATGGYGASVAFHMEVPMPKG